MTTQVKRPQRSDARDNRARILAVARLVFAAEGIDVPIREIARRVGVGVATVYRHFPSKEDLLAEAVVAQTASCANIVEEGLAHPDPWRGLWVVIETLMGVHALDRGCAHACTSRLPASAELRAERDRTLANLLDLVELARRSGALRDDVVFEDIVLMLVAHKGIEGDPAAGGVAAANRFAAFVTQSFRNGPDLDDLPPAVSLRPSILTSVMPPGTVRSSTTVPVTS